MDSSSLGAIVALLMLSSFVKYATVLSVFRYGAGLIGFELGAVALVAALALSVATLPKDARDSGLAFRVLSGAERDATQVAKALSQQAASQLDPAIVSGLYGSTGEAAIKEASGDLSKLLPAATLSQLKSALTLGLLLLIPFVLLDLLVAHVLSLLGVQQIGVQVVSMPLKVVLFLAVDGWGLLGAKILAGVT